MSGRRKSVLRIFTIYDHPEDYPNEYVVCEFHVVPGKLEPEPKEIVLKSTRLPLLRKQLRNEGLYPIDRDPTDDEKVVETWL